MTTYKKKDTLSLLLALPRNNGVGVVSSVSFGVLSCREFPRLSSFGWLINVSPLASQHCYQCYNQPRSNCLKCSLLAWKHKPRCLSKPSTVFSKVSREMAAQALRIHSIRSSLVVNRWAKTTFLIWPYKNKYGDVRSDEQGGHLIEPRRPIHLSLKFKFKNSSTMSAKCGGAPSRWKSN